MANLLSQFFAQNLFHIHRRISEKIMKSIRLFKNPCKKIINNLPSGFYFAGGNILQFQ
jgi:hypothetical protein